MGGLRYTPQEMRRLLETNDQLQLANPAELAIPTRPELVGAREHELQQAVIAECQRRSILQPEYGLLIHIPNGEYRPSATARRLKAMGVVAGVPDLFLPAPRQMGSRWLHGMFIELKVGKGRPSLAQLEWMDKLRAQNYFVVVCYDTVEAVMRQIEWYLSLTQKED